MIAARRFVVVEVVLNKERRVVGQLIRDAAARLEAAGVPDPEHDAAVLLASVLKKPFLELRLD
ncbi:hypothetical protein IKZ77_03245, partial [Candidatus Saccharibacteria bacterium]|nr:hypothetical protein [Candidatus Saccharibacteria bacterium]